MRSILVHAERADQGEARIQTALSLARMTGGHVTYLVDTPVMRFTAVDALGGATVIADALHDEVAADDAFAAQLDASFAREDVPGSVLRAESEPLEALARASRLADVAIVHRLDPVSGDLPLATRCPVLAVNADQPLTFPLASVAIAWDGGAEAAAALRGAVPLLAGCVEVVVLTVEDAPAQWPATDALEYLSRHGIRAELQVLSRIGSIEDTLLAEFRLRQCQLLVMGCFGHSRIREYLFGGVTRAFLEAEDGPALLLAH